MKGVLVVFVCIGILLSYVPVPAQTIRGRVVEQGTGEAIAAALVSASWVGGDSIGSTQTDSTGRFSVRTIRAGQIVLHIERLGYQSAVTDPIRVGAAEILSLAIELAPSPVPIEPIVVTTARLPDLQGTMLDAFYERRFWLGDRLGIGTFIDPQGTHGRGVARLSDLLRTLPGVRFWKSRYGGLLPIVGRNRDCLSSQVYLDGVLVIRSASVEHLPPMENEQDIDMIAVPSDLAGIEVYRGGAQMPAEFGGSAARCGVIALWTQRGR